MADDAHVNLVEGHLQRYRAILTGDEGLRQTRAAAPQSLAEAKATRAAIEADIERATIAQTVS